MKEKSDRELLAIILRDQFRKVAESDVNDIIQSPPCQSPLTEIGYQRLMAAIELGRRISEPKPNYNEPIVSSTIAMEFCKARFHRLIAEGVQEEFHIVTLDTRHRMINTHLITVGTLDASLVHPREVFRPAIRDACSCVLLTHNHPSGDPTPSTEDKEVTRRMAAAGEIVGIAVLDHIIVAKEGCASLREYI